MPKPDPWEPGAALVPQSLLKLFNVSDPIPTYPFLPFRWKTPVLLTPSASSLMLVLPRVALCDMHVSCI